MNNHQQIKEWLAMYEQLSIDERQQVDKHLQGCQECVATLAAYRTMDQQLQQLYVDKLHYLQDQSPAAQQQLIPAAFIAHSPVARNPSPDRMLRTGASRWVLLQVAGVGLLVLLFFVLFSGLIGRSPFEQHVTAATPTSLLPTATITLTVPATAMTNANEPTVVRFVTYDWAETTYAPLIAEFEAANPDIQIEISSFQRLLGVDDYQWPDDAYEEMLTKADVVDLFISPRTVRDDLVRDLTPLMVADPTFDRSDFYPNTLTAYQWGGGTWGIPMEMNFNLIYYRKDLFDAAGVAYPQSDWTWAEFAQIANRLTQRTGDEVTVWGFVNKWADHIGFIESQSGPIFNGTPAEIIERLQDPAIVAATQRYVDLLRDAKASPFFDPPAPDKMTGFTPESALVELGQAAMWTDMAMAWQWHPDPTTIGVVPFPTSAEAAPSTAISGQGRTMSTRGEDPDAAWRWLSFLSRKPRYGLATNDLSPRPSLDAQTGIWQQMDASTVATMRYAIEHSYSRWFDPDHYYIEEAFTRALTSLMHGEKNVTAALDSVIAMAKVERPPVTSAEKPVKAEDVPVAPEVTSTVTITFLIGYANSDLQIIRTLANAFEKTNPAITVRVQYPPYQEGIFGLAEHVAAADCFDWSPAVYNTDQLHLLRNLEPFFAADETIQRTDFYPGLLAQFTVQDQLWALPSEARPKVITFNKALFGAAEVAYPTEGWTIDDFAALAAQVTNGSGLTKQYGFIGDTYELTDAELLIKRRGGHLYDLTINPPGFAFTQPATVAAVTWYTALTQEQAVKPLMTTNLVAPQPGAMTYEQRSTLINIGRAAMWSTVFGFPDPLYQLPKGLQTGLVPLPRSTDGAIVMDPMFIAGYYISAQSPNAQACWAWIRFLTEQPDAIQGVPARRSVAESATYQEQIGKDAADVLIPLIANYTPPPDDQLLFTDPWLGEVRPWWEETYQQIVTGESAAQPALAKLQQRAMAYRDCIIERVGFTDAAQQQACFDREKSTQ